MFHVKHVSLEGLTNKMWVSRETFSFGGSLALLAECGIFVFFMARGGAWRYDLVLIRFTYAI